MHGQFFYMFFFLHIKKLFTLPFSFQNLYICAFQQAFSQDLKSGKKKQFSILSGGPQDAIILNATQLINYGLSGWPME